MPTGTEALQQAIQLHQTGKKSQAARLLVNLLKTDPANEQSWWLLSTCVDDPQKQRDCLDRVLLINPYHLGARMTLERLNEDQPSSTSDSDAPPMALDSSPGYASTEPFAPPPFPEHSKIARLLEEARAAVERKDFGGAYELYHRVLEQESSRMTAWLGQGYCAARLSDGETNRFPEFFDSLSRAVLARDSFGLALNDALARLDPAVAQAASNYMLQLASFAAQLALSQPQPMANVYAVERVHLADWAYTVGRQRQDQSGTWFSQDELIGIAADAYQRILTNLNETQRNSRARAETMKALRGYLLNNLTASGLNRDPAFLAQLDRLEDQIAR